MKVIEQGHTYELENMGGGVQHIQFIKKELNTKEETPDDLHPMQVVTNGTTNEEAFAMLIDRMCFLQAKMPSRKNAIVITKLEECLMWLEKR